MNTQIFGVATKAIIYNKGKYLILFKSDKEEINPNSYDIPGGRIQFGEKPENAILREVKEETNLEVEIHGLFNCWTFIKETFQLVGIDFFCIYKSGEVKLGEEHNESIWASAEEIFSSENYPEWIKNTIKKAQSYRKLNNLI